MYNLYILIVVQIMMIQIPPPPNIKMLSTRLIVYHEHCNITVPVELDISAIEEYILLLLLLACLATSRMFIDQV